MNEAKRKKHLRDCCFWLNVLGITAKCTVPTTRKIKLLPVLNEVTHNQGMFGSSGTALCIFSIGIVPKFSISLQNLSHSEHLLL